MGMMSGQGRFDGMEVELYEGKFGGGFDLDEIDGERISFDTTFVFMVTAIAGKTTFDVTSSGDVKRVTQFNLHDVVVLDPHDADGQKILATLASDLLSKEAASAQLPGQTSILEDAPASRAPEYLVPEGWDEEDELYEPEFGTMGAQTVGSVRPRQDETLKSFLEGP